MPPAPMLAGFVLASIVLAVTPGPGVMYIVTRSLTQGRAQGLASVAGVALGNLGSAVGAAVGLAALFALVPAAFIAVKLLGAAYLIGLGIRALRAPVTLGVRSRDGEASLARVMRDGALVALLNPKTTIFFAAFLPQFMSPGGSAVLQGLALGSLFVAIAALSDAAYALGAALLADVLPHSERSRRWARCFAGGTYLSLGLLAALSLRNELAR